MGAGNLISGNGSSGILFYDASTTNTIQGNLIGSVGGFGMNIISGNASQGVALNGPTVAHNLVLGNFIGVAATGTNGLGERRLQRHH